MRKFRLPFSYWKEVYYYYLFQETSVCTSRVFVHRYMHTKCQNLHLLTFKIGLGCSTLHRCKLNNICIAILAAYIHLNTLFLTFSRSPIHDDESIFPPKADEKCHKCALNHALPGPKRALVGRCPRAQTDGSAPVIRSRPRVQLSGLGATDSWGLGICFM